MRGVGGIEDSLESNAKPEEGPGIVSLAQKPGDSLESSAKSRSGPEARMGGMKPGDSLSSRAKHSDKYEEPKKPKKQTLESHSVCSSRSGWKSSQAVTISRVAGAMPSLERGEECVNTQTGSVGVADPQSNIVYQDMVCGKYELYEECSKLMSVREDKNPHSMPDSMSAMSDNNTCSMDSNVIMEDSMCMKSCLSEGVVSLKNMNHNTDRKPPLNSEVRTKPVSSSHSNSTLRLKEYFSNLSKKQNLRGEVGRGEKFSQGGKFTPTKRKLCETQRVSTLVKVFNYDQELPACLPGDSSDIVGSPAKRQRVLGSITSPASRIRK